MPSGAGPQISFYPGTISELDGGVLDVIDPVTEDVVLDCSLTGGLDVNVTTTIQPQTLLDSALVVNNTDGDNICSMSNWVCALNRATIIDPLNSVDTSLIVNNSTGSALMSVDNTTCNLKRATVIKPLNSASVSLTVQSSDASTLLSVDNTNGCALNRDMKITTTDFDNTLYQNRFSSSDTSKYEGTSLDIMSTIPSPATGYNFSNWYYSRLSLGTSQLGGSYRHGLRIQAGIGGIDGNSGGFAQFILTRVNNQKSDILLLSFDSSNNPTIGMNCIPSGAFLDVQNSSATLNPLTVRNAAGTSIMSVDNSGNTSMAGTLTLNGTTGSNITLPTTYSASPTSSCLGYKVAVNLASNLNINASGYTNVLSTSLAAGVWVVVASGFFLTTSVCNWFVTGVSLNSAGSDNYAYQPQWPVSIANGLNYGNSSTRILSLTASTTVYFVAHPGTGTATAQANYCKLEAVRIA